MSTPIPAATLSASDPALAWVWFVVLFVFPAIGYAVWFVTEWRQPK